MPVHFDATFRPNGWMRKPWGPLVLPLTPFVVITIVSIFFRFDPKMAKCDAETRQNVKKVLRRVMFAMSLFLGSCSVALIWAAWGSMDALKSTMFYGLPLMMLVTGNSLGKLRPNYTMGIRLPWTLESPVVWTRTHRFAGRVLVCICLGLLLLAASGWWQDRYLWIMVAALLSWAVITVVYAFAISRREEPSAAKPA
jgi:uncharacterized membrane protein